MINKILKNSIAVFSNSILASILAILLVPMILSSVGQEQYGLVVLTIFLSVRNGILGIFMFGIQAAVIKFVAEYAVKDEYSKTDNLLGFALLCYSLISAAVVITLIGIKDWLFGVFFSVPPSLLDSYLDAFSYALVSIFFQFFTLIILGYFEGSHKFIISKAIDTLSYLVYFILVIICLAYDYGFLGVVKLLGLMHIWTFFLCLAGLKMTNLRFSPSFVFDRQLVLVWLRYSGFLFLGNLSAVSFNHSPKLFVATMMSPSVLAIYDIISKIPASVKSFVGLGNRVIVPVASELDATTGSESNNTLFSLGLKLNLLVFIPFIASLALLSQSILFVWVGPSYAEYSDLMQILYLVPALSIFMSFGFSILMGTNHKLGNFAIFGWSILILSCLYWYFRIEIDGLVGLTVGRVFGLAITTPIAMGMFLNHFKVNSIDFCLRITALIVSLLIPVLLVDLSLILFSFEPLFFLLFMLPILYLTYFSVIYFCLFGKDERSLITKSGIKIRTRLMSFL